MSEAARERLLALRKGIERGRALLDQLLALARVQSEVAAPCADVSIQDVFRSVLWGAGFAIHKPLARIPQNTLKFAVGAMLSAFGVFWIGEGLHVPWPGEDLAVVGFAVLFLLVALSAVAAIRNSGKKALL